MKVGDRVRVSPPADASWLEAMGGVIVDLNPSPNLVRTWHGKKMAWHLVRDFLGDDYVIPEKWLRVVG
jgi:hypothetical protein